MSAAFCPCCCCQINGGTRELCCVLTASPLQGLFSVLLLQAGRSGAAVPHTSATWGGPCWLLIKVSRASPEWTACWSPTHLWCCLVCPGETGSEGAPIACTWNPWGLGSSSTQAKGRHVVTKKAKQEFPVISDTCPSCSNSLMRWLLAQEFRGFIEQMHRTESAKEQLSWVLCGLFPSPHVLISTHSPKQSLQMLGQTDFQFSVSLNSNYQEKGSDLFTWLVECQRLIQSADAKKRHTQLGQA